MHDHEGLSLHSVERRPVSRAAVLRVPGLPTVLVLVGIQTCPVHSAAEYVDHVFPAQVLVGTQPTG